MSVRGKITMTDLLLVVLQTVLWASLSTVVVALPGIPLAYALARYQFPGKMLLSTLTGLPMVLPPTAVGFVLLSLLADHGPLGRQVIGIDLDIILTWKAVVLACSVMSAPLVIRTAQMAFAEVNPRLEDMSRTLGRGMIRTFLSVTLPMAGKGLAAALVLGFTRALGEFGATVIIAGNIPGQTRTIASAIYSAQQAGHDSQARLLVLIAVTVGFCSIFLTEWLSRRPVGNKPQVR